MKIIRIIFFSLLALIFIASASIFIFFQSFNSASYLSKLEVKASDYLGRPVSIAGAGLGLSLHGITLDAGPVLVADDPNFTTQPFIEITRIRIVLSFADLLIHHKIHIENLLLDSPEIHFIRSVQGVFNFHSIGQGVPQDETNKNKTMATASNPDTAIEVIKNKAARMMNIEPRAIEIRDASVSYIDQSDNLPLDIWLNDINAKLNDFSLAKPFSMSWQASLYSNTSNVHAQAQVSVDIQTRTVTMNDFDFQADLTHLDKGSLEDISPELMGSPILASNAGIFKLHVEQLTINASNGIEARGNLDITGGVIKDVNIVKLILSNSLKSFGGLSFNIDNFLGNQELLSAPDTTISKIQAQFSLHQQDLVIDDSTVETNIFELEAKGVVKQGKSVDLQTVLHLNQDISSNLINQFRGLKILCDDGQRITIDAVLKGDIPHLKYEPTKDFRKKSKKALLREGFNMLGAFLGRGFLK